MAAIGIPQRVHTDVPEPIPAPTFPQKTEEPKELPAWLNPNNVPVPVRRS